MILDEVHHAGDALSWGEGVREAFEPATRRLALTGTPFRSDINPIPFVTYAPGADGVPRRVADFTYGYAHALADHVVRPVLFMAYSGEMQWRTRAGDEVAARLGEPLTKDLNAQALRTALDPDGAWIPSVLAAADTRLTEVRRHVPDAGGLVIATDQDSARAYAKLLRAISGEAPTVVLSDEKAASKKIATFTDSDARWMVAVRMVSEGVDVPRLAVGVYATTTATPLFFAQAVGRFVRARGAWRDRVGVPAVGARPARLAAELEASATTCSAAGSTREDDLLAAEAELLARAKAGERRPTSGAGRSRRSGREARFDQRAVRRRRRSATPARCTSGPRRRWTSSASPGCSSPTRCASLLHQRQQRPRAGAGRPVTRGRQRRAGLDVTSSWPCCAASSTAWSPPGTTAPASRTGSPTPSCARRVAARPPPSRRPTSSATHPPAAGDGRAATS